MDLERRIANNFLSSRPTEAARILETVSQDRIRALLEEAEIGAAAAVVEAMTPLIASRCLGGAPPSRAAEILQALPLDRAADLVRRAGKAERAAILSELPSPLGKALERLLSYPDGTAGAMMEPRVESFTESTAADSALRQIRRAGSELRYYLYVVNDRLELTGVVSLRELVSSPPDATLGSIMTKPVQSLAARAGRSSTLGHPAWRHFPVLPVIDEAGRLVGVFRYETLRELEALPSSDEASPLGVALALGELFWLGASGVVRGMEERSAVTGDSSRARKGKRHESRKEASDG